MSLNGSPYFESPRWDAMRYRAFVGAGTAVLFGLGVLTLAGCGGSTTSGGGGPTTPTVTVSASPSSITTAQSTTVTVTVSGSSGTPTGTVTLTNGTYSSGAVALSGGSAQISIAAGKLATGSDILTATYSSTSSSYNNASGTGTVTVTGPSLPTPTVTVWPFPWSVTTTQSTAVTVILNGGPGNPGATGTVTLTSGSYNSGAVSLNASQAQITIPGGALATGIDTLTATYAPDSQSSSVYNGASGTAPVNVTASAGSITPSMTISPDPSNITLTENTTITISMSGGSGNPTPTGSVILTGPNYYSSGFVALTNGSAQITVKGSTLGNGTVPLTVTYGPDANSSSLYTSAIENGSVIVSSGSLLTPTVTVTPNPSSITTAQSTTVTVTVNGGTGNPAATGSVTLTCIQYTSSATALVNGSAQITIPAGSIPAGNDTMTAVYTPDANSSSTYTSAMGTNTVTVTAPITPTVTVSTSPSSIASTGSTTVTVAVGSAGNPTPTGSVTLTSGTYSSGATTLTNGSAQIIVQGSSLATGSNVTLSATYTPDTNGSLTYSSATGSGSVTVIQVAITSFTASANPIPYGSTSTQLTGVFTGGTGVITPGNLPSTSGTPVTVSPTATTTYTLTVTPTNGTAITQTVAVSLASAGVTLNPASLGIAVTDQILGMNMAQWYDEIANANAINAAFNGAGIKAIRWPGGSWSDQYHWGYQTGSSSLLAPYMCNCSSGTQCTANSKGWAGTGTFAQL